MNKSLISVIIPVYAFNEHFEESIFSIIQQSYTNIEILIIDDSNDISIVNVINNINDDRIRLINGNKAGLSDALNLGIKLSNGYYIARMDSDDIAEKDRLHKQSEYLQKFNLDICGSNIKIFGSYNQKSALPEFDDEIKFYLLIGSPLAHPTIFAKSEVIKKFNYNTQLSAAEDYDLWCRMATQGVKFGNCPEYLLNYRTHLAQATKTNSNHHINSINIAKNYSINYLSLGNSSKFLKMNCGFNSNYSTQDVFDILIILKNAMFYRNIKSSIINKYLVSLHTRITNYSIKTLCNYFIIIREFRIKVNYKLVLFLIVNLFFSLDSNKKYFSIFKRFN
jgi:glycosyltransferase involved in cell wall biosynthesis